MAEVTLQLHHLPRTEAWPQLEAQARAVLEGVTDEIAVMATLSSLVHHAFGFLWTGFYRVVAPGLLRVGPYQGTPGCLELRFGRGVCGTAAATGQTQIVRDVHAFAGHIACDARAVSELVVPVFDAQGRVQAVFDLDSERPADFNEIDARAVERLAHFLIGPFSARSPGFPGVVRLP